MPSRLLEPDGYGFHVLHIPSHAPHVDPWTTDVSAVQTGNDAPRGHEGLRAAVSLARKL